MHASFELCEHSSTVRRHFFVFSCSTNLFYNIYENMSLIFPLLFEQIMKVWVAIETTQTVQFRHLREQTPSWMDQNTKAVRTRLLNALSQLAGGTSKCLHFKMADGVHPVLRHGPHSSNMAKASIARKTVKEDLGQTMFTSFKMKKSVSFFSGIPRLKRRTYWKTSL